MNPMRQVRKAVAYGMKSPSPPDFVSLYVTDKCNLRCQTCWRHTRDTYSVRPGIDRELTTDEWIRVVRDLSGYGVRGVQLCGGGEPLLRNDARTIMKEISSTRMSSHLVTNGTLLTRETAEFMDLIGWGSVTLSIDGNEEQHDMNRGEGMFSKAMRGVSVLRGTSIPFHIETVITRHNEDRLSDTIILAESIGALSVRFLMEYPFMGKARNLPISSLKKAGDMAYEKGIPTNALSLIKSRKRDYTNPMSPSGCVAMWNSCIIAAQGDVIPCCFVPHVHIGNVTKEPFKSIWEGNVAQGIRKSGGILPGCDDCEPLTLEHQENLLSFYRARSMYPIRTRLNRRVIAY